MLVHASTAAVPPDGQQQRGFLQKVQKSIRDFGFGKRSFVEGGVGLFVFTGIGALLQSSCTRATAVLLACDFWSKSV